MTRAFLLAERTSATLEPHQKTPYEINFNLISCLISIIATLNDIK